MIPDILAHPFDSESKINSVSILQSQFVLKVGKEVYKSTLVTLYENYILITLQNNSPKKFKMSFDFDLIFDLMIENQKQEKQKKYQYLGLKFQRLGHQIELLSPNQSQLTSWRNQLEKRINQRGFHQLFKPIKKIGKGNFASVYLVVKYQDKKKYAVKAFSKEGTYQEQNGKQSLVNEIQINRKLNHKNLMKIYGVYQSQNSIYVSVQLLQGGQLHDKFQTKHKFTPPQIKSIMRGLCQGLQYMHSKNIMHRDLKPQNIILRQQNDWDCVIADFGLATLADQKQYLFVRCGTPGYVAPEIVNLKDLKAKYDPICDMFSLGVIFHMLALKKPPFPGTQYNQVLSQNRACKIDFSKQMYQKLPQQWLDLMIRLLQKDPKKRISAKQALEHDFFNKNQKLSQALKNQRESGLTIVAQRRPLIDDRNRTSMECDSPLMTTANKERKNPALLRDDSCLKFKMKQNILTGKTDEGESVGQINSPLLKKGNSKPAQSRFKRMTNE